MRSSAIIVLAGLVLFHLGTKLFQSVAFAIAFLIFMVPLPQIIFNAVAFPLQTVASESATRALDFLGVPVLRDGNVIHLSRVSLGVSEACSGIRSLISLLAIAVGMGLPFAPQPHGPGFARRRRRSGSDRRKHEPYRDYGADRPLAWNPIR